jgi:hypothetical protein
MAQYSFYIPSFHIQEIRSAHTDALFASTALKVMNPNGSLRRDYGAKGVGLGDRKAGGDVVPGLAWENVGRAGSDASESGRGCRLLDLCAGECPPYRRRVRFRTQSKAPQLLLLTLHETTRSRLRPPDRRHLFRAEDVFSNLEPGRWSGSWCARLSSSLRSRTLRCLANLNYGAEQRLLPEPPIL